MSICSLNLTSAHTPTTPSTSSMHEFFKDTLLRQQIADRDCAPAPPTTVATGRRRRGRRRGLGVLNLVVRIPALHETVLVLATAPARIVGHHRRRPGPADPATAATATIASAVFSFLRCLSDSAARPATCSRCHMLPRPRLVLLDWRRVPSRAGVALRTATMQMSPGLLG